MVESVCALLTVHSRCVSVVGWQDESAAQRTPIIYSFLSVYDPGVERTYDRCDFAEAKT